MQCGTLTVGTTPQKIPITMAVRKGVNLKLLEANSGIVYKTADPAGAAANLYPVDKLSINPAGDFTHMDHFSEVRNDGLSKDLYVVGSASGQVVSFEAQ